MTKILKICFGLLVLLLVTGVALFYVFRDKLAQAALTKIKSDLAEESIFVDCRLEPISLGTDLVLKLRDIKTFKDSHRKETAAELSKLDLHVHLLPSLEERKPYVGISVEDGTLILRDLEPKPGQDEEEEAPPAPAETAAQTKSPEEAAPAADATPEAVTQTTAVPAETQAAPEKEADSETKVAAETKVPEPITVSGINLQAELDPQRFSVASSSLVFQGVRIAARGVSAVPQKPKGRHKPLLKVVEVPDPSAPPKPSKLDFSALVPVAEALDYRDAEFTPELQVRYSATLDRDAAWDIDAKVDTVSFPSRDKNLAIEALLLVRYDASGEIRLLTIQEGKNSAKAAAIIAAGASSLTVSELTSTLDWFGILRDLPVVDGALNEFKLVEPPSVELAGVWSIEDPKKSHMTGAIKGFRADYTPAPALKDGKAAAAKPPGILQIGHLEALVQINAGTIEFKNGYGTIAGGLARFDLRLDPFETNAMPWELRLVSENLSLAQLTSTFAGNPVEGTANLSFEGKGDLKPEALNGQGGLLVVASEPLKIPLVGPLMDLLATVVPNLFKSESDRLQGSFVIKDGVVSTEDASVGFNAALVKASGSINLVTEQTEFTANANLRGPLQRLTAGLPDVLAIEGGGPISKVNWRFKNLPGGASSVADLLRGAVQGTRPPSHETPPATGDAASAPQGTGQPAASPAPSGTPALPGKAGEILRTVDQIGGLLKGIKATPKPAPAPAPAPATPEAPAPNP